MAVRSAYLSALLLMAQAVAQCSVADSHDASVIIDLNNASDSQKLSYLLGLDMHEKRSKQGFTLDPQMVAQAIHDEQTGSQPELSSAEYMRIVILKREMIADFEASWQALSKKNLAEGAAFLQKKALEPGVMATDSGLLYRVLQPGIGQRPTDKDIAKVHYRGTMLNGEEFDSSYKRGKPADFPVGKVKPALREVLLLMREGAKWVFYSPPNLAYGKEGGGQIGPNETLTTEVELLEILE
ncbi:MAG TPA: FKBP-type peptidyl-prolyl cis-trans isomerase [Porticoccaceae bacterium]|nr:FKBP-type peptidyl-prolyl cis-trans isomerase [Porticoccaceae bacterium]HIL18927.1 FKBP-type peptidyl-prolyl cis-trans isomerase [Gammaproteobacteria bacterium]